MVNPSATSVEDMDILPVNAHQKVKEKAKEKHQTQKGSPKERERIRERDLRILYAGHAKRQGIDLLIVL